MKIVSQHCTSINEESTSAVPICVFSIFNF